MDFSSLPMHATYPQANYLAVNVQTVSKCNEQARPSSLHNPLLQQHTKNHYISATNTASGLQGSTAY
jgi:hypothetical protein